MTTFEEELQQTGKLVFTNKGVSMMPLLRHDRDLMVICAKKDGFQKNDVVLFKRDNGQYVLHRIARKEKDGTYYIIGDNCLKGEKVRPDQLLGILTDIKRGGKTISLAHSRKYRLYVKWLPIRHFYLPAYFFCRSRLAKAYHKLIKK